VSPTNPERPDPPSVDWPEGVTPISVEELGKLGLNEKNQLFWDGRRIEIRNRLDLTRLQKTFAIVVSVFAVLGALGGFLTGLNNASVFLCARGTHWLTCPTENASSQPAPRPAPRPARDTPPQ
jgi:hypothetical protein